MSHISQPITSIYTVLLEIDRLIANKCRTEGCHRCEGKEDEEKNRLDQANYPRIGYGIPKEAAPFFDSRFSFCCAGCRKRTTPPSIRFLGRRRFVAVILVVLSAIKNPCKRTVQLLVRNFDIHISLVTLKRWQIWWQSGFPKTQFWTKARADLPQPVHIADLPIGLVKQFTEASIPLVSMLVFISPITTGSYIAAKNSSN